MRNKELIIDSGIFIALFAEKDQHHKKILSLRKVIENRRWITTWPVLTEVCHLLGSRGHASKIPLLFELNERGGFEIFSLTVAHVPRLKELIKKYAGLPMDLADASLVILSEEIGHGEIVSTDTRDFEAYRWKNKKPFKNLFHEGVTKRVLQLPPMANSPNIPE